MRPTHSEATDLKETDMATPFKNAPIAPTPFATIANGAGVIKDAAYTAWRLFQQGDRENAIAALVALRSDAETLASQARELLYQLGEDR